MFPIFHHPNKSRYVSHNSFLRRTRRGAAGSPLLRELVAYWKLDEASGTRNDCVGLHHLSAHGGVAQGDGKLGAAAQFNPATLDYLSTISRTTLQVGASDFTLAGWVYLDSPNPAPILGKWEDTSLEYLLAWDGSALSLSASNDGLSSTTVTGPGGLETELWYHFTAWHDTANATLNLAMNGGVAASESHAGGIYAGTADLNLGRNGSSGALFLGRLDEVGIWRRLLSTEERVQLYNAGAGLAYPF